ncbi:MAG TPA: TIGR03560 family F420-dependent LLM class oxidoreductase [Acidimicrobiales bacterium]|nr:TIGR03560 family F420-dependent LLM class oxidoreductase [Acidimicrobiales bacterium]
MRFSVWPNPQRTWDQVREIVERCDETGWDGAYYADHFMPDDPEGRPSDGAYLECWSVLAGLAARTERLRLGSLVSGNLYRHPAVLANTAATIDHMSGGRLVLGLGAGWQVNEHAAYGIDLPAPGERVDRLEEACAVVSSLLRETRTTYSGRYYRLTDAPCEPKRHEGHLPLLVGGAGEKRTLPVAARYADEWNAWTTPDVFKHKSGLLDGYCEEIGRDPGTIRRSTQAMVFLSKDESWLARFRDQGPGRPVLVGTPAEVTDRVGAYQAVGVEELIVPDWTMGPVERTLDTLEMFRTEVAAHFG